MNNLNEVSEMKLQIMNLLMMNQDIMMIVEDKAEIQLPNLQMRYTQIVPWKKKMDTQLDAQSIIAFEINPGEALNPAVRKYVLYIWVMVHDSLMVFDKAVGERLGLSDRGTRLDVLAAKVDHLINGSESLGFGEVEAKGAPLVDVSDYYHGRMLTYEVKGWNRHGDKI